MIQSKIELRKYLDADSKNYPFAKNKNAGIKRYVRYLLLRTPSNDQKTIWDYIVCLRKSEYAINTGRTLLASYYLRILRKLSYKTGFQIPLNVCGPGLTIWHWGTIIINDKCKIGANVTIHPLVTIGHKKGESGAPEIGNNVIICGGSYIVGSIKVGNNVIISNNSVVTHDIPDNCMVAGSPARIVKQI